MKKKKYEEIIFKGFIDSITYVDEFKTVFLEVSRFKPKVKYTVGIDVNDFEKWFNEGVRLNIGEWYTFVGILHKSNGYNCVYCRKIEN